MTKDINKILSSINIIFKKINLLTNIDNYIITKELKGGMYTIDNDDEMHKQNSMESSHHKNDINYILDDNIDFSYIALQDSINRNTELINDMKELVTILNINNNKYIDDLNSSNKLKIDKLMEQYDYIIKDLERYRDYYAYMAQQSEAENYKNSKYHKQRLIELAKSKIQPRVLLTDSDNKLKPWKPTGLLHNDLSNKK
jgi:hypothetical protein